MNLENFKKIKIGIYSDNLVRLFLALVFLSAGVYRVFNPDIAIQEFVNLKLPTWLSPLMIIFEIGTGLGLFINIYTKQIYYSLLLFLIIVLSWSFIIDGHKIVSQISELFIFNLNPTDWFLHLVFLLLILFLFISKKRLKN